MQGPTLMRIDSNLPLDLDTPRQLASLKGPMKQTLDKVAKRGKMATKQHGTKP